MTVHPLRPGLIRVPAGVSHLVITRRARSYYVPDRLEAVWELGELVVTMRIRVREGGEGAFREHASIGGGGPDAPESSPDLERALILIGDEQMPDDVYTAFIEGRSAIQIMGRPDVDRDDLERHELAAVIYNEGPRRGAPGRVAEHFGISRTGAYHLINKAKAEGLIASE